MKALELGQGLQSDLDELAKALGGTDADVMASSVASKFSSPSSEQAKLLRVLKTIDYMYSPKHATPAEVQGCSDVDKIQGIYESFRFTPLWTKLEDSLSVVEERPEMEHIATVLLLLIEEGVLGKPSLLPVVAKEGDGEVTVRSLHKNLEDRQEILVDLVVPRGIGLQRR